LAKALGAIMLNIIMLSAIMLSEIMLSVIMLSVIMLNVVAPFLQVTSGNSPLFWLRLNLSLILGLYSHSALGFKNNLGAINTRFFALSNIFKPGNTKGGVSLYC
jgi:hypothetical protein